MNTTNLKKYISLKGLTLTDAAKIIGCSRQRLTDLANGKTACGRKLAFRIQKWSDGMVDPMELMRQ